MKRVCTAYNHCLLTFLLHNEHVRNEDLVFFSDNGNSSLYVLVGQFVLSVTAKTPLGGNVLLSKPALRSLNTLFAVYQLSLFFFFSTLHKNFCRSDQTSQAALPLRLFYFLVLFYFAWLPAVNISLLATNDTSWLRAVLFFTNTRVNITPEIFFFCFMFLSHVSFLIYKILMPRLQEQTLTESAGHKEVTDVWISSLLLAASGNSYIYRALINYPVIVLL